MAPIHSGYADPNLPLLDPAFVPVSVIVCGVQTEDRAGGGTDLVAIEEHSTDVAALVAALRLPAATTQYDICTTEGQALPWFAVVDATGHWVRPGVATDDCGRFRPEVTEAVSGLALARVATRVLREGTSDAAARAGCSQEWTDMVWVETTLNESPAAAALTDDPFPLAAQVRSCLCEVPAQEQGSDKPAGVFSRGGLLGAAVRTQVTRLLLDSGPALDCARQASRFAVLVPAYGPGEIYVELDG